MSAEQYATLLGEVALTGVVAAFFVGCVLLIGLMIDGFIQR